MANSANEEAKRLSMECIETALLGMMHEQPFDSITYGDLAKRAGVSRNAIYRNYLSKEDILKQYLRRTTDKFLHTINHDMDYESYLLQMFRHLEQTKNVGSLLLKEGKSNLLYEAFLLMRNRYHVENDHLREYYDYYRIGGIYCVYLRWLETQCKETPEDLCAIILQVMRVNGIVPDTDNEPHNP